MYIEIVNVSSHTLIEKGFSMETLRKYRFLVCTAAVVLGFLFVNVASAQNYEAENLTRTASAVGATVATNQAGASNNAFVYLTGTPGVNDWMEFVLSNATAGTYNVKIYCKAFYNRGICRVTIDGQNLGSALDLYNANQTNQMMFDLGTTAISSGNHQLRLTVTGKNGSSAGYLLTLDNVVLTQVSSAPVINTQPQNQTVIVGNSAMFTIAASGSAPLSYAWRKNGTTVSGATSATYATPATVIADNGALFSCVVSNSLGSMTSANALLTVTAIAPTITTQPQGQTVPVGSAARFTLGATGTSPLSYRWRKNGTDIVGATGTEYTTPPSVLSDNGSLFSCVVSNAAGSVTSTDAQLSVSVQAAPVFTTEPFSSRVTEGQTAVLTVAASGSTPLSFQWKKGAVNVGSNSTTHTIASATLADAGSYWAIVSNAYGADTSSKAMLTVLPATLRLNSKKMSINGELRNGNGTPVGSGSSDTVEMTLRVINSDTGGAALYVEQFRKANDQGVVVDNGFFSARLGEGATEDDLALVLANNPHLWVEIIIEGVTADTLRPRTPLTANGQSMVSGGAQTIHGNGAPHDGAATVVGTMYIDDMSGLTWLKLNSGWKVVD